MSKPGKSLMSRALAELVRTGECTTLVVLHRQVGGGNRKMLAARVGELINAKYVRRSERGCYEATALGRKANAEGLKRGPRGPHTGIRKPETNTIKDRAWKYLRITRKTTVGDIAANAARPGEPGSETHIGGFLKNLQRFGIVTQLPRRRNGRAVWLLLDDLGPRAPVVRRVRATLFNPNNGTEIPLPAGASKAGGAA